MARQNAQVPLKEKSGFNQGRSGSGTMKKSGPVKSKQGGPVKGGGITEKTKGKMYK